MSRQKFSGTSFAMVCFSAALCLVMAPSVPMAAQTPASLAFQRAKNLQHGINTGIWFAQSPRDYSVQRLRTFTTVDDLVLIGKLGFDHIRLSVDADPLTAWQQQRPDGVAFVGELDKAVDAALAQHLAVIIDVHPESAYKQRLLQGTESVQRFARLWRAVAEHYKSLNPDMVFFEIMNEPEQSDAFRWQGIEAEVAEQIRSVAPQQTIIAAGAHWSGLDDLLQIEPIGFDNVIYTFHDYEPFPFTHQGATWTEPAVQPLRGLPYPSTPEAVAPNLKQEPTLSGQYFVEQYGLGRWNAERIDSTLAFAERWSKQHNVPVYCGEFGVHKPFAEPAMRAAWTRDMRTMLAKHHIGWAMWDYQTNFGVVSKQNGVTTPDSALIDALGLRAKGGL